MERIHIVGAQRSGTTLMHVLMASCFAIDGYVPDEISIFTRAPEHCDVYCSKNPRDILWARWILPFTRNVWFLFMVRDPRDMIVSTYDAQLSGGYYVNLQVWKESYAAAKRLSTHPRFITVKYETLLRDPESVQHMLMQRLSFLSKVRDFANYHHSPKSSDTYEKAMHGTRPLDASSIGTWRQHKPRVLAQLQLHGPITQELIELGYEADDAWLRELDGVVPDNKVSYHPDRWRRLFYLRRSMAWWRLTIKQALGIEKRPDVLRTSDGSPPQQ